MLSVARKPPGIVYVVDDDQSVRRATTRLLRTANLNVETFATADDFLENYQANGPCCLLLDLQLPGLNGIETQQHLADKNLTLPIVFMTGHGDIPTTVNAMKNGAVDFLTKPVDDQTLIETVQRAIEQHSRALETDYELEQFREGVASLTKREHEVMLLVITGMLNKQIARKLGITEATVKVHRGRMMEKTGIDSVAELAVCCERAGLSSFPSHRNQANHLNAADR
jgi:FixJ family two-component response regulator